MELLRSMNCEHHPPFVPVIWEPGDGVFLGAARGIGERGRMNVETYCNKREGLYIIGNGSSATLVMRGPGTLLIGVDASEYRLHPHGGHTPSLYFGRHAVLEFMGRLLNANLTPAKLQQTLEASLNATDRRGCELTYRALLVEHGKIGFTVTCAVNGPAVCGVRYGDSGKGYIYPFNSTGQRRFSGTPYWAALSPFVTVFTPEEIGSFERREPPAKIATEIGKHLTLTAQDAAIPATLAVVSFQRSRNRQ